MVKKTVIAASAIFLLIFLCTVQFSCSKTAAIVQRSKFEILTQNKWKVQALYFRDVNEPVSANVAAMYFTFKSCEVDDIYLFKADSTFSRTDSLLKCDPQDLDPFHINVFGPYGNSFWTVDAGFTKNAYYASCIL